MKILIDARPLGTKPSGVGIYIYNFITELNKDKDFDCALITDVALSSEMKELEKQGVQLYRYGKKVNKNLELYSYYKFVQWCINDNKPDIFWESNNLCPVKIENPYGRMFVTIHDMFPLSDPEHYGRIYPHYFRFGIKQTIKYFDTLIYNSYNTKKETEKYFPVAKEKKSYVGYIIIPEMESWNIKDNNCFLYIGNLETRKGTDILLEGYKTYREKGGKKGLRLGGKVREPEIQDLLDRMIESVEGITYLGYLTEEDRNNEYASCSAFLFPSRAEGFGIPIIEVMNYNKPVIAGNLDTLKEIAGDGITYFSLDGCAADNLAEAMLAQNDTVDLNQYKNTIHKYSADVLGKQFKDFLKESV